MLHIAVCEDEELWRNRLLAILRKNHNYEMDISVFPSGEELLADFMYAKYDLIFMDIYMSGMSGVDTVTAIRQMDSQVSIAFTTTSLDHALEGYRLNVIKYLEKPLQDQDVYETLRLSEQNQKSRNQITIKINKTEYSFAAEQISYLEQKNHVVEMHLTNGTLQSLNGRLDVLVDFFPASCFYRCHKSFLVNLSQIERLDTRLLFFLMKNGARVYITREKIKEAGLLFDQFLFNELRRDMK